MLLAKVVCSDPKCTEEAEVAIGHVRDLEGRVCDCGFGFVLIQISELTEPGGEVISIIQRSQPPSAAKRAA